MASFFDLTKPHLAYYSNTSCFPQPFPASYAPAPDPAYSVTAHATHQTQQTAQRIQRAEAAMANGFETLGMYSAGIVAAVVAGVPAETLNYLSVAYLASRVGYNTVYIWLQDNRKLAPLRSVCWNASIGIIAALWIKAGNKAAS
ncbi:hypothetical protein SLS64_008895 [Diaporthe eres]